MSMAASNSEGKVPAIKQTSSPDSLAKKLEEELTCAVCLQRYNVPKVLPCLHLYCKDCLIGLKKTPSDCGSEKKHITCPKCKAQHNLPENGIDGFKTHYTVNNIIEVIQLHEATEVAPIVCQVCGPSDETDKEPPQSSPSAYARCVTCAIYLCKDCHKHHKLLKLTKDHNVITLEEIKQSDRRERAKSIRKRRYCEKHKEQEVNMFCKSCKKDICRDCALVKHREHEFSFVYDLRLETEEMLKELMRTVQEKEKEFRNHMEHIRDIRKQNKESLASCTEIVEKAYQEILKKLESHRTNLLTEIRDIHDSESKQINAEECSLSLESVRFQNGIRFTQQLLENGDDLEVMAMSVQAEETLISLGRKTWDKDRVKPLALRVKLDSMANVTDLKPFGTILHKIQPDAIIATGFPEDILVGKKVSFQVQLSSDIAQVRDEVTTSVQIKRNNDVIPVEVEPNGENYWSVSFTPKSAGCYDVAVTIAHTTKEFSLTVDEEDYREPVIIHEFVPPQNSPTQTTPAQQADTSTTPLRIRRTKNLRKKRQTPPFLPSLAVERQNPVVTDISVVSHELPDSDSSGEFSGARRDLGTVISRLSETTSILSERHAINQHPAVANSVKTWHKGKGLRRYNTPRFPRHNSTNNKFVDASMSD